MKFKDKQLTTFTLLILLLVSGCAMIPESLKQADLVDVAYQQAQQSAEQYKSSKVRWGGVIIDVQNKANVSVIEVLKKSLSSRTRPRNETESAGRFLVEIEGFIDPEIFTKGSELTVVGELQGIVLGKVGEFDYHFPVIKSKNYYLWGERQDVKTLYPLPAYWHYPWSYPPYHPPVIIHKKNKKSISSDDAQ